jgi:GTP pyrophosphokinase
MPITQVKKLSHEGRGIAEIEGKTIFLSGGLPGETVEFELYRKKSRYAEGQVKEVFTPSPSRVDPPCQYANICGGCSLQHIDPNFQIKHKQSVLLEQLLHIGGVEPLEILPPLTGPSLGYRRKARLGVRYVRKKEKVLVGFREKNGRFLTDHQKCLILDPRVGEKLENLQDLIQSLEAYLHIPQIEVAAGDDEIALIFRHLKPLSNQDQEKLIAFGKQHQFKIYLHGEKNKIHPLYLEKEQLLSYRLPDYDLKLFFETSDFTQVNAKINQKMLKKAMELLSPKQDDLILDLFSGLGNFSLPLAKLGAKVHAVEVSEQMVERGRYNAKQNNIHHVNFYSADLEKPDWNQAWMKQHYDKILLDPPRTGTLNIIQTIDQFEASKILYISCNSATLARDTAALVKQNYILKKAGIMDMFPHTKHMECIALFEKVKTNEATKKQLRQGYASTDSWLFYIHQAYPHFPIEQLRKAIQLVEKNHGERVTQTGQSCLQQSFGLVDILIDLKVDIQTLTAAIIYGSVHYADLSLDTIEEEFSLEVRHLIQGVMKMDVFEDMHTEISEKNKLEASMDNFKKMLLAIVDDTRVVLIKLAEQLYILHHLNHLSKKEQVRIANTAMNIYASLANRLGVGHLKWQIEDMAFRHIDPEKYQSISHSLNQGRLEREKYVQEMISSLETLMNINHIIPFKVMGRAKHIYSIYRKMQKKKVNIEELYDTLALRILVSTIEDCYAALGYVHAQWKSIPKEFDDYIVQPKPNGYRSLHTAVIGPENKHVEIQIRTHEMHEEAELGVAAHWAYKEGGQAQANYENKKNWLNQVMDWQKEMVQADEGSPSLQTQLLEDRVYIFTPNGDVIDLPKGATPLDFAYSIHSEIGHHCRGAKVGGVLVPLTYSLKTGDRVEILTAKNHHPSKDWLNPNLGYLKTSRAKSKVTTWFRQQEFEHDSAKGKEIIEKELKRLHIKPDYSKAIKKFRLKSTEELWAQVGRGDLNLQAFIQAVQPPKETSLKDETIIQKTSEKTTSSHSPSNDILIGGVEGLLSSIAQCCKPIYKDPIVGYVTVSKGITIHRADCPNLLNKLETKQERLMHVSWNSEIVDEYEVDLLITANDRKGLMRDITNLLATMSVNITRLNSAVNQTQETAKIFLTIQEKDLDHLKQIINHLEQIEGVFKITRMEFSR